MRLDGARGRGLPPVPLRPRQPGLAEGYGTLDQAYAGKERRRSCAHSQTKDFAFLAAYAASVASAQPMDVAQPTNAGVGQYELRGLQGAETSAPQQEQRKSVQPDLFMHSQSSVRAVGRVDHRFSRSGMGVKGLHPSRQRLAH